MPMKDRHSTYTEHRRIPQRIITVRLPADLHSALMEEAYEQRKTLNLLCIEKLKQPLPEELRTLPPVE